MSNNNPTYMEVFNQKADSMPKVLGQKYTFGCLRTKGNKNDTSFMIGFCGKTNLTAWKDKQYLQ